MIESRPMETSEPLAGLLKHAIDVEDFEEIKRLMSSDSSLHRAPIGYAKDGPLTWVAEPLGYARRYVSSGG